jgi:hypothetical protein
MPFSSLENLTSRSAMRRDKPNAHRIRSCETPRMSPPPSRSRLRLWRTPPPPDEDIGTSSTTVPSRTAAGTKRRPRTPRPGRRDVQNRAGPIAEEQNLFTLSKITADPGIAAEAHQQTLRPCAPPHHPLAAVSPVASPRAATAAALVEPDGVEPTTSCVQGRRSPN